MATPEEILLSMGLDPNEAVEVDRRLTTKPRRDKRICLCGHSVGRHDVSLGRPVCVVGKQYCNCRKLTPVLEVEDTRTFIRKTEGSALNHALTRGLASAIESGQTVTWIEEARFCYRCDMSGEDIRLTPMAVSANGVPQAEDTGYNVLFCDDCRLRG